MTNEILTAALVLITGFYAWATFRILKANERVVDVMHAQAEAMTRPFVAVSILLELDNPIFYLCVSNVGKTAANDLRLTLDKPFYRSGEKTLEKNLAEHNAFKNTIASFPPGAQLTFSLAQSFVVFGNNANRDIMPTRFTVTAEYSYGGKRVKEENHIDLEPYLEANIPQDPYVRKLKGIKESIDKVSETLGKSE
jgi:hypothetical protein